MRLPNDPFDFVTPKLPDFRIPGWELVFGRYQWFYVFGARALLAKAGVYNYSDAMNKAKTSIVPQEWEENYGSFEWRDCANNQVFRAITQKVQRFDKAILSIISILNSINEMGKEDFRKKHEDSIISEFITLKPANFEIADFDQRALDRLNLQQRQAIMAASAQRYSSFLDEIAKGHGATYGTLNLVANHLGSGRAVSVKDKRGRNARTMRPAPSECVV